LTPVGVRFRLAGWRVAVGHHHAPVLGYRGLHPLASSARPAYEALLTEHRRLLRAAFAQAGGAEVETRGDSFLVAFRLPHEAVEGAVEAQRALAAHTWPDRVEVRVRMGMHTGEPVLAAEGYIGLDVHRAARIGETANGGQVLVSESTRALIGDEVALRDLGEYRLAGLERPERLYQVVAPDLASEFGPLRAGAPSVRRKDRLRTPGELEQVGWRLHDLLGIAPAALSQPLEALAGKVLAAARLAADADRTLASIDRGELASRVADYEARASVALHVAQARAELSRQLAALDRLPERRPARANHSSRRWRSHRARPSSLLVRSGAPVGVDLPRRRQLRRRRGRRSGRAKHPKVVASLAQALELRELLRAARRGRGTPHDPHAQDHHAGSSPWNNS
jgi:Adenylate and Guanylate cyclase catalytic domain